MTQLKVGLIGAGYIASRHATAISMHPNAHVVAVCDLSATAAEEVAADFGAQSFTTVEDMIAAGLCDTVHILTPPNSHASLAIQCLNAGLDVVVEKPFALSQADCDAVAKASADSGKSVAVCHNFLALPAYEKLSALTQSGQLGKIDTIDVNWRLPLTVLRSGPFGLWMLREPQNLLFELGPHLFAFAADLAGQMEDFHIVQSKPIMMPGATEPRYQTWRINARAGSTDITFNISLVEGIDDRSVTVRGTTGLAKLDYASDVLTVSYENTAELVVSPLQRQLSLSWQHLKSGTVNALRQATSLNRKAPYDLSFQRTINSIYDSFSGGTAVDKRFSLTGATQVIGGIETALNSLPATPKTKPKKAKTPLNPTALVVGGTGFIGRHLTRTLVAEGYQVRVLSRSANGPFGDIADQVELFAASLKDPEQLEKAMDGIDVVYHLAKSENATWEGYLENDLKVTQNLADAALKQGVKRFIYTGTIASYDMSDPSQTITEATGFGDDIESRNHYARAKALSEETLLAMHHDQGLPLVIARPGIVIGQGGPLQHWGIGKWNGAGAVRVWGHGRNILPFVLIDDVSDALIAMIDNDAALGQSFNLVGDPLWTARDYFDAIREELNAELRVSSSSFLSLHMAERVKYILKSRVLKKQGLTKISLSDWKSRGHLSPFDNSHTKEVLGWTPVDNAKEMAKRTIGEANLFGF